MNAHKATITSIFDGTTLIEIPFFQRSYVWDKYLWERFLNDMEFTVKTKSPHFLGTLIFKDNGTPKSSEPYSTQLLLIDGQQRLTTYLIFLKVLCLKLGQSLTFDSHYRFPDTNDLSLQHGKNDRPAFENDDEQQIFDSLNSLGVSLTTSELLKNYFFSRNNLTDYQTIWEPVFDNSAATKEYWDTIIETGRIRRPLIDIFFDAYFQLFIQNKKYSISTEDKLIYARTDRLSNSYQSFVDNYCGGSKQIILSSLREYAELFRKTFQPDICDTTIPSTFGIERLNVVIFGLKTTTLIPYVLYLAKNISDTTALNKMYGILESYVMRRIVTHATSKNYNNLFLSLIANEILDADDLRTRLQAASGTNSYIPTDTELQDGFEHSKLMNLYSKGVLYLIESHIRPAQSAVVLHGFNNYSLEHLMPKKWRNNWPACSTPLAAEKRDSILLTLGNLAIIPQSLNASIRDSDWSTKKAGKGQEKPGLTLCASGLSTLQNALTKTDWNESEIQTRALWLYKQAQSLWKF